MKQRLSQFIRDPQRDFRFIPFTALGIYVLLLVLSQLLLGSYVKLGYLFGIRPIPYFMDLQALLAGVDAWRAGIDPYTIGKVAGGTLFNYPVAWKVLSFVPFISSGNLVFIAGGVLLLFWIMLYLLIGKINFRQSLVYTLLLVSPVFGLAMERANCDLIIFILLAIALLNRSRPWLYPLLFLPATALKFFPLGTILVFFAPGKRSVRQSFLVALAALGIMGVYFILTLENMQTVSAFTPRPFEDVAYGLGVLPEAVASLAETAFPFKMLVYGLELLGFVIFFVFSRKYWLSYQYTDVGSSAYFLAGSGVFVITNLIGYNWEYRLVFLVLCMPFWLRAWENKRRFAFLIILLHLLLCWQSFLPFAVIMPGGIQWIRPLLSLLLFYIYFSMLLLYAWDQLRMLTGRQGNPALTR